MDYSWDFGDGETSTGSLTNHTFDVGGTYKVVLTVTDDRGNTSQKEVDLEILPEPMPEAVINVSDTTGFKPLTINFDGSASTPTIPTGTIVSYSWDFGDGNTANGANVSHVYNSQGKFYFQIDSCR